MNSIAKSEDSREGSLDIVNKKERDNMTPASFKKCSSMTLAISASNANRMLEASRALNASMKRLGDKDGAHGAIPFDYDNLITAVRETKDDLLCSFLDTMVSEIDTGVLSEEEMKLSLLLFLDMDKSSKLLSAFEILRKYETERGMKGNVKMERHNALPSLKRTQVKMLFQSFLTSISTCINFNDLGRHQFEKEEKSERKSIKLDSSDSPRNHQRVKVEKDGQSVDNDENKENNSYPKSCEKKSEWHVKREIEEIAKYATDKVFDDLMQKQKKNRAINATDSNETTYEINCLNFQEFGEWYNSGGYSLVPWLELLDLAKWDYAGRSAASVEAASRNTRFKHHSTSKKASDLPRKSDSSVDGQNMNNCMKEISLNSTRKPFSPARPDMFLRSPANPPMSQDNVTTLSEVLISFNFSSSRKDQISITRENLLQLQHLVTITDFSLRSPGQIANVFLRRAKRTRVKVSHSSKERHYDEEEMMILSSHDFGNCIRDLIPSETLRRLSSSEIDSLMNRFTCFFLCYSLMNSANGYNLAAGYVNAKELAVGLSFLCNGNKSTKLASTFELIGDPNFAYLSQTSLLRYLRSYLTMLGSISLLSLSESNTRGILKSLHSSTFDHKIKKILVVVEYGSTWTLDHFLQNDRKKSKISRQGDNNKLKRIFFEDFASWYTDGGFTVAPWLEFLDLRKFTSLLDENEQGKFKNFKQDKHRESLHARSTSSKASDFDDRYSRSSVSQTKAPDKCEKDILFTFPLANKQNLVVLREDAAYVRTVVDHLGLLHLSPEEVSDSLYSYVRKNTTSGTKKIVGKGTDVDQKSFVTAVEKVLPPRSKRKRSSSSTLASTPQETLVNFYQSFDLNQTDHVAVNQLMGGLTLLCGGKKSTKLSFAFSLFDTGAQPDTKGKGKKGKKKQEVTLNTTLCGKELFYFFRSFLIVMFSCCKQSLDLTADAVGRYIADTANMVTDEVMKYQWNVRKLERVNFVDFGEWYNEGGFETAPWLELLDLNKWVLLDQKKAEKLLAEAKPMKARVQKLQQQEFETSIPKTKSPKNSPCPQCPSPSIDDQINADTFFDEIEMDGIGGDIGDMGFFFPDANEKDCDDQLEKSLDILATTPSPYRTSAPGGDTKALKFQLFTNESNAYTISISPQRVLQLRHLVIESNLYNISIKSACDKILQGDGKQITRERFDSAMYSMIGEKMKDLSSLGDLLDAIFNAFDFNKLGKADATELACGLTVLCGGRKSDKLEYAFELLDKEKRGLVSRFQMVRYLQSFLLVLLNISSCPIDTTKAENILIDSKGRDAMGSMALARVICGASSWATEEIFKATPDHKKEIKEGTEHIDFDNFADWYTKGGYNRIAWLELLDLKKWVLSDD